MKYCCILVLLAAVSEAFVPATRNVAQIRPSSSISTSTSRPFGIDPSQFQDSFASIQDVFTSLSIADADAVAETATEVTKDQGWFGFLTGPIYGILMGIHSLIAATGTANSWGISIISLTLLIKIVTYPLTKSQLESTNKMQAVAPAVKELQAKYQSNPEVMNQKVAEFYQVNEINPLAGCLPSLIQIPVFIGLYRAVLDLAEQNKLDEPFLFLPSLEGPTYGADPTSGSDWILKGWVDGVPSLGWDDTLAFLVLPIFLVVSQYVSMELMQPKSDDPAQQQSNAILKVLPLMIGWFSLNVPSALCVYWVINNIVTTATTLVIKNMMPPPQIITPGSGAGASAIPPPPPTIFAPPREKPSGFGSTTAPPPARDAVKPITTVDAVIVEEKKDQVVEVTDTTEDSEVSNSSAGKSKRSGKKKRKRD